MTTAELKQRIEESLSAPFQFSHEGISTVKDLLRCCLSRITELEHTIANYDSKACDVHLTTQDLEKEVARLKAALVACGCADYCGPEL